MNINKGAKYLLSVFYGKWDRDKFSKIIDIKLEKLYNINVEQISK